MSEHMVQFYEDDGFLIKVLTDYVGGALATGDTAIVINTSEHLASLRQALTARQLLDASGQALHGNYITLQADAVLDRIFLNDDIDETRFRHTLTTILRDAAQRNPGRIFLAGETASVVLHRTDSELDLSARWQAAVRIERFCTAMQRTHDFTLLCTFPLNTFPRLADAPKFAQICDMHADVLPAESFDPDANIHSMQRAVAELQQQAYSLATEVHDRLAVEQALREVNIDRLTGLPNRNVFHDRLEMDIRKAHRNGLPLALLFIDLDHFKEINDTLGHDVGDQLLKQVGARLQAHVRLVDTVARLGGDEFTVTLSDLHNVDSVTDIADKIRNDLARPFRLNNELAYISASIGITLYPRDASTAGELLRNADQAMYLSKDQGRNRFSYFTASMQEAAQARMAMSNELRRALVEHQLRVYYQPIIDMRSGAIGKAEALVRWMHPSRGKISPVEFIPVAEHSGQIASIGSWVFRTALATVRHWRSIQADLVVHVNVSPAQFFHPNGDNCRNWLHDNDLDEGIHPEIGLEITESLLLGSNQMVMKQLLAFQQAGMEISLDDFGTGYSSLSYLRKFNLNCLKIDQSFVYNLEHDAANLALCEAIIVMAHKLGLTVVAEGVESEQQYQLLREAGCDYGQGMFFGMAMPPDEFEAMLKRSRHGAAPRHTA